jgi:Plasmid stabilization system protein|nr:type II toxin-antitoxin system RelE/ParE family toxin [uncultured Steroidobacter sp.]
MSRYDLTARAAADLREIVGYTKQTWGIEQARHYREELEVALQKLSLMPDVGRQREALAPGVRSFRVAAHIAFYVQRQDGITILRLLHPSMDVDAAFG